MVYVGAQAAELVSELLLSLLLLQPVHVLSLEHLGVNVGLSTGWHWGCLLSSLVGIPVLGGGPSLGDVAGVHGGAIGLGGGLAGACH